MKIRCGKFTEEYIAPLWMYGIVWDINHDGTFMWSVVFGKWYIGVTFGNGSKNGPQEEEKEMYENGRRSIHAAIPIHAGQIIEKDSLIIKRPGLGIPPYLMEQVIGRTAKHDIQEDEWITWDMV